MKKFQEYLGMRMLIVVVYWLIMEPEAHSQHGTWRERMPNATMIEEAERLVKVEVSPKFNYSFERMQVGVRQHIDRKYTYDVIPSELINGYLFQGIHRPSKGTEIKFTLLAPAKVYYFFHFHSDGGYTSIFAKLNGWKRLETFPQYDIHKGGHGLKMVMYELDAKAGSYTIPPTTAEWACFNIVFQPTAERDAK